MPYANSVGMWQQGKEALSEQGAEKKEVELGLISVVRAPAHGMGEGKNAGGIKKEGRGT